MQCVALLNDYTSAGGKCNNLIKGSLKLQETLTFLCTDGTSDQELRDNVVWLMKLRPLHITRLLGKVAALLQNHNVGCEGWRSFISRIEAGGKLATKASVAEQLFVFDAALDSAEGCVQMWHKFLARCDELVGGDFSPRTQDQ